jgi:hypothetical protein
MKRKNADLSPFRPGFSGFVTPEVAAFPSGRASSALPFLASHGPPALRLLPHLSPHDIALRETAGRVRARVNVTAPSDGLETLAFGVLGLSGLATILLALLLA